MKIGVRLRDFRMKADKTLKQISEETGLSVSFISDVERGRVDPSLKTLQKFAKVYDIHLSYLFIGVDS